MSGKTRVTKMQKNKEKEIVAKDQLAMQKE
ncbi:MAG: hypothetical protein CM15mV129_200 [uncultured marine virus]|nr:MAG: hypothetical protein CM15mV129_200 [uncultured marine virus]